MTTPRIRRALFAGLALPVLITPLARADYQATVLADAPRAYYRFNDNTARTLINVNSGSLGAAGNATNDLATVTGGKVHSIPGAINGDGNRAVFFDLTTRTEIPFNAAINTPNTQPFTLEAWLLPVNDQDTTSYGGMGVLANRWAQGGNRQGWVMYQRRPNSAYSPPAEGVGWEFRMYNDLDGSGHLDVVSQAPFQLGKWQHVVIVYEPLGGDPTNSTLTVYIDGVAANTNINTAPVPGYAPCTGNHDPAPNGQPAMALGNYNNANSGTFGAANPWIGGIDEFAWYPAKLTPAQILAHYQNGTNANRAQSYSSLILSHNPTVYLRLDEIAPGGDFAVNIGAVGRDANNGAGGVAGLGTHTAEVRHPAAGAIKSDKSARATAYHNRNGRSTTTIPYNSENNGDATASGTGSAGTPFTFETWIRPMRDTQGGQCPVNNRMVGGSGRTGWVIFQRFPNASYASVPGINNEGHGWCFRMFDGAGTSGHDVLTGYLGLTPDDPLYHAGDYTIGQWQHLVVTWQPQQDNGDPIGNGNNQWQGILTAYVDGVAVATNNAALYAANRLVPEPGQNGDVPADFAVGSYNAASTLGNNPFEGDVAELAIYNNYILTSDQILAHYQAGTNSLFGSNYATMVITAAAESQPAIIERTTLPATYFRLNDTASYPAANSASLGYVADGDLSLTTNNAAGPRPASYAGFEPSNNALPLDGLKQWASFNNPPGLNIANQISLEAWIQPGAAQVDPARIISHGHPTMTDFINDTFQPDGAVTNSSEVFLRIDGAGANYVVGATAMTYTNTTEISSNFFGASLAIPGGDLGSGSWIHLVGTYDGAKWNLYRNGILAASAVGSGALAVNNADWAVGSTGNGWADPFTGNIDEAAIYDKALTAGQIGRHYVMGVAGTIALTITPLANNNVRITWPAGTTLQQATAVTGPYTDVPGPPTSPLTIPATGTKFYRWRL